jgi:chorismate mutase
MGIRSSSAAVLTALVVLTTTAQASAAQRVSLSPLADVAAERVLIADLVAAAKFGTTSPIDDPAREQVLLDTVAAKSVDLGIDPAVSARIFRDQIEANKDVQRGLFARWTEHPEQAPTERPDLATEVRPKLDLITTRLLEQIRDTGTLRRSPACHGHLIVAIVRTDVARDLDRLHRRALDRSLDSFCG